MWEYCAATPVQTLPRSERTAVHTINNIKAVFTTFINPNLLGDRIAVYEFHTPVSFYPCSGQFNSALDWRICLKICCFLLENVKVLWLYMVLSTETGINHNHLWGNWKVRINIVPTFPNQFQKTKNNKIQQKVKLIFTLNCFWPHSFYFMKNKITWYLGLPTMDGKTARGASSPANPALHIPEPLSTTKAATSSSHMF